MTLITKKEELKESKAISQNENYLVLSDEELEKGFVNPLRFTYRHVGIRPKYYIRMLEPDEVEKFSDVKYIAYEQYPEGEAITGRYWTQEQLSSGCKSETRMADKLAETYARDPGFYGQTFCCQCNRHFDVDEFIWLDGTRVGSKGENK